MNGSDAIVYPGETGYNQLTELAPDMAIEHPDSTFEDACEPPTQEELDETKAWAELDASRAWLCGLLKTLDVKYERNVTHDSDPTEYINLAIGGYQIKTFFDDIATVQPDGTRRQLRKGTEEWAMASMFLDAARKNYDEAHDFSHDPMGYLES